jgi:CDP-diacylglycerol--glycerol-3-phosphate 3-phosphatidyltransferase
MLADLGAWQKWAALLIFVVASITDALDGHIARSRNLITNFGKFMDPVADKLLVCSALICFVQTGVIPAWIVIIIVAREFIVSGFRLVASDQGIVLAAGIWGKLKTVCQMVMTIVLIADIQLAFFQILGQIFIYASLLLTIISMVDYIWNNRQVLTNGGM